MGWAILVLNDKGQPQECVQGVFKASASLTFHRRLESLAKNVEDLVQEWQPTVAVIENIFLGKNANSAFKLGHIRGACIVQCLKQGAEIVEYSPREVKKIITGNGSADKMSLRRILYQELGLTDNPKVPLDASDALAMAYGYSLRMRVEQRWTRQVQP